MVALSIPEQMTQITDQSLVVAFVSSDFSPAMPCQSVRLDLAQLEQEECEAREHQRLDEACTALHQCQQLWKQQPQQDWSHSVSELKTHPTGMDLGGGALLHSMHKICIYVHIASIFGPAPS